jgi:hypothetical protein
MPSVSSIVGQYQAGIPLTAEFAAVGVKVLLTLYGDIGSPIAGFAMEAATASIPDQAYLSDHQKVAICVTYPVSQPYSMLDGGLRAAWGVMEAGGWAIADTVEGYPDTGSSINDLSNEPTDGFPDVPGIDGLNAGRGFTVVAEKTNNKPDYSESEMSDLFALLCQIVERVNGKEGLVFVRAY